MDEGQICSKEKSNAGFSALGGASPSPVVRPCVAVGRSPCPGVGRRGRLLVGVVARLARLGALVGVGRSLVGVAVRAWGRLRPLRSSGASSSVLAVSGSLRASLVGLSLARGLRGAGCGYAAHTPALFSFLSIFLASNLTPKNPSASRACTTRVKHFFLQKKNAKKTSPRHTHSVTCPPKRVSVQSIMRLLRTHGPPL